jgi:hypothetical protein
VGLVKVGVVYVSLLLIWGATALLLAWLNGRRPRISFRDRLLGTMLLAALLPLALLLVYSQLDVRDRMMESMAFRLEDQTAGIAQDIAGIGEHADASSALEVRPDRVSSLPPTPGGLVVGTMLRINAGPSCTRRVAGLAHQRSAYAEVVLGGSGSM